MFNGIQEYINAANSVTSDFEWKIQNAKDSLAEYENLLSESEDSKDYYASCIREEKIKIEMIEAMKNAVIKIVKASI